MAVYDDQALYLALDIALPAGEAFDSRDKVDWAIEAADEKRSTPAFYLSATGDGEFDSLSALGASNDQAAKLKASTRCAVAKTGKGWSCEWRVPWTALGVSPGNPPEIWRLNIGVYSQRSGVWLAWVPTGSKMCEVQNGGELSIPGSAASAIR